MRRIIHLILIVVLCNIISYAKSGKEIIAEEGFKSSVSPLLTTQWSQDNGENSALPFVDTENTIRAKTGCGATAMAQVMNYWKYPTSGHSYNYYWWEGIKSAAAPSLLYADFKNTQYDWENMINRYKDNPTITIHQLEAIGTLFSHIGIALEMKYDSTSTATQIEYISSALKKYFKYNPNMVIVRQKNYNMDEWLSLIYKELSNGRPIIMGGEWKNANHIYVADGYDSEGRIHFNLGHANNNGEDKYYDITKNGETYTTDMRMILGIAPHEIHEPIFEVHNETEGLLSDALGEYRNKVCRLKVTGNLNNTDIQLLCELSKTKTGQLSYIDLTECSLPDNSLTANAFNSTETNYTLQQIILPDNLIEIGDKAFRNCRGLINVHLPEGLKTLGNYVFSDCRYLESLNLGKSVDQIGSNPFRYSKLETFTIDNDNINFKITDGYLLSVDGRILYSFPLKYRGEAVIPNNVETIKIQAFLNKTGIYKVTLPSSLKHIEKYAFFNCHSLNEAYSYSTTAPNLSYYSEEEHAFYPEYSSATLHVPVGCSEEYSQTNWNKFKNIIADIQTNLSGINKVILDPSDKETIYNISGNIVKTMMPNSIYIIQKADGTIYKSMISR